MNHTNLSRKRAETEEWVLEMGKFWHWRSKKCVRVCGLCLSHCSVHQHLYWIPTKTTLGARNPSFHFAVIGPRWKSQIFCSKGCRNALFGAFAALPVRFHPILCPIGWVGKKMLNEMRLFKLHKGDNTTNLKRCRDVLPVLMPKLIVFCCFKRWVNLLLNGCKNYVAPP